MSKDFRVTEIFRSLQGEGMYQGVPSIFVRFFGCSLRCPGFNLPHGTTENEEVKQIIKDLDKYEKFEDLPLVQTGCDSYASDYPEFKKFANWYGMQELADEINSLIKPGDHVILTGGEPMLPGWQKKFPDLIKRLRSNHITIETNATQPLSQEMKDFCLEERVVLTFSISPKLPNSGHDAKEAIHQEIWQEYRHYGSETYLKFVVDSPLDLAAAFSFGLGLNLPTYLMPCGGTSEVYQKNKKFAAEAALELGWRYSDRLQVDIWKNGWGT